MYIVDSPWLTFQADLDLIVPVLVKKSAESNGFIADEANRALAAMAASVSEGRAIGALVCVYLSIDRWMHRYIDRYIDIYIVIAEEANRALAAMAASVSEGRAIGALVCVYLSIDRWMDRERERERYIYIYIYIYIFIYSHRRGGQQGACGYGCIGVVEESHRRAGKKIG